MPVLGFIKKSDDGRWAYGIGAFPAGFGAPTASCRVTIRHWDPISIARSAASPRFSSGLSYSVTDRLSVGITVGLAISDVELHGPFYLSAGPVAIPAVINMQGFGIAPTGSVGMQYQVDEDT